MAAGEKTAARSKEAHVKKRVRALVIINLVIWVPLIALVVVGIVAPPFPNDTFAGAPGIVSFGTFVLGLWVSGRYIQGLFRHQLKDK